MSSPGPSHMCRQQKIAGKRKLAATAASTLLACLFLALAPDTRAEEAVSYRLVYDAAQTGGVIVTITLPPGAEAGTLIMPREKKTSAIYDGPPPPGAGDLVVGQGKSGELGIRCSVEAIVNSRSGSPPARRLSMHCCRRPR